eukprot:PhM_4_TR5155/c1_g1_i3/m.23016
MDDVTILPTPPDKASSHTNTTRASTRRSRSRSESAHHMVGEAMNNDGNKKRVRRDNDDEAAAEVELEVDEFSEIEIDDDDDDDDDGNSDACEEIVDVDDSNENEDEHNNKRVKRDITDYFGVVRGTLSEPRSLSPRRRRKGGVGRGNGASTSKGLPQQQPPPDCVSYHPNLLPAEDAAEIFAKALLIGREHWKRETISVFQREVVAPRKTLNYVDIEQVKTSNGFFGNYAGIERTTENIAQFPDFLRPLMERIESVVNNHTKMVNHHQRGAWKINAAIANLYETGADSVGWHSDTMTNTGPMPIIASYSLGASRLFRFRPIVREHGRMTAGAVLLKHNDLCIMWPPTQEQYQHSVPEMTGVTEPRINFTFRMYRTEVMGRTPMCKCNKYAVMRCASSDKVAAKNYLRYFYCCNRSAQMSCNFFVWCDDDDGEGGTSTK